MIDNLSLLADRGEQWKLFDCKGILGVRQQFWMKMIEDQPEAYSNEKLVNGKLPTIIAKRKN